MDDSILRFIKKKRKELNLNQEVFADALNIQVSSYSKIELGTVRMTDDKLAIIARILGMTAYDLKMASALESKDQLSLGHSSVTLREHLVLQEKYMKIQEKYTAIQEQLIRSLEQIDRLKKKN